MASGGVTAQGGAARAARTPSRPGPRAPPQRGVACRALGGRRRRRDCEGDLDGCEVGPLPQVEGVGETPPRPASSNLLPARAWPTRVAAEIARALYEDVWSGGEYWILDRLLSEDHLFVDSCWGEPHALVGRRRFENLLSDYRSAYPDLSFALHDVNARAAGQVYVYWTATGTNRHGFLGLPPTGAGSTFSGVTLLRVDERTGTVRETRVFRECPLDEMAAKRESEMGEI